MDTEERPFRDHRRSIRFESFLERESIVGNWHDDLMFSMNSGLLQLMNQADCVDAFQESGTKFTVNPQCTGNKMGAKVVISHRFSPVSTVYPSKADVSPVFHERNPRRWLSAWRAWSVMGMWGIAHRKLARVMIESSRAVRVVALKRRCTPSASAS